MPDKFLVVCFPAPPAMRGAGIIAGVSSVTTHRAPAVKWVTASNPEKAVAEAGVEAGGYALVAAERDVRRFNRPDVAPLVEYDTDGSPLPTAGFPDA